MPRRSLALLALASLLALPMSAAQNKKDDKKKDADEKKEPYSADTFAGLELRGIGPAMTSGRIVDIAVDPSHPSTWYVASASGGTGAGEGVPGHRSEGGRAAHPGAAGVFGRDASAP